MLICFHCSVLLITGPKMIDFKNLEFFPTRFQIQATNVAQRKSVGEKILKACLFNRLKGFFPLPD